MYNIRIYFSIYTYVHIYFGIASFSSSASQLTFINKLKLLNYRRFTNNLLNFSSNCTNAAILR